MRAKSGPYSTSASLSSGTPRASSALVNTPVPGPSSITGAETGVISAVMALASAGLDGAMAATRRGSASRERKNVRALVISYRYQRHSDMDRVRNVLQIGGGARAKELGIPLRG